jgi:hypothetical protein
VQRQTRAQKGGKTHDGKKSEAQGGSHRQARNQIDGRGEAGIRRIESSTRGGHSRNQYRHRVVTPSSSSNGEDNGPARWPDISSDLGELQEPESSVT